MTWIRNSLRNLTPTYSLKKYLQTTIFECIEYLGSLVLITSFDDCYCIQATRPKDRKSNKTKPLPFFYHKVDYFPPDKKWDTIKKVMNLRPKPVQG